MISIMLLLATRTDEKFKGKAVGGEIHELQ